MLAAWKAIVLVLTGVPAVLLIGSLHRDGYEAVACLWNNAHADANQASLQPASLRLPSSVVFTRKLEALSLWPTDDPWLCRNKMTELEDLASALSQSVQRGLSSALLATVTQAPGVQPTDVQVRAQFPARAGRVARRVPVHTGVHGWPVSRRVYPCNGPVAQVGHRPCAYSTPLQYSLCACPSYTGCHGHRTTHRHTKQHKLQHCAWFQEGHLCAAPGA